VIAGTVNHTTGEIPARYRGRLITEEWDGPVRVLRCHVPSSYFGASYLGRMWGFLGFTLSSSAAIVATHRPDVIVATSPPLVTAIPGFVGSRFAFRRVPWVFEVRDLWPESAITTKVLSEKGALARSLFALESFAYSSCDRINVLTPAFRDDILRRGLARNEKIVFVPNGADAEMFRPAPRDNRIREEFKWGDRFVVMYAGAHGRANAVGQLVDAAERLRHRPDILIATVGDGPERPGVEADARRRGIENIMFCGAQPKQRMPEVVNACDVGAAVLQNNPTFRTVYPNKVFDYMACERPVLLAIDGVARKLVCEDAEAGAYVEPENPAVLAAAIEKLADDPAARLEMGRRGRKWVLQNCTRESLAAKYLGILAEIVEGKRGPVPAPC